LKNKQKDQRSREKHERKKDTVCAYCKKRGHGANECRKRKADEKGKKSSHHAHAVHEIENGDVACVCATTDVISALHAPNDPVNASPDFLCALTSDDHVTPDVDVIPAYDAQDVLSYGELPSSYVDQDVAFSTSSPSTPDRLKILVDSGASKHVWNTTDGLTDIDYDDSGIFQIANSSTHRSIGTGTVYLATPTETLQLRVSILLGIPFCLISTSALEDIGYSTQLDKRRFVHLQSGRTIPFSRERSLYLLNAQVISPPEEIIAAVSTRSTARPTAADIEVRRNPQSVARASRAQPRAIWSRVAVPPRSPPRSDQAAKKQQPTTPTAPPCSTDRPLEHSAMPHLCRIPSMPPQHDEPASPLLAPPLIGHQPVGAISVPSLVDARVTAPESPQVHQPQPANLSLPALGTSSITVRSTSRRRRRRMRDDRDSTDWQWLQVEFDRITARTGIPDVSLYNDDSGSNVPEGVTLFFHPQDPAEDHDWFGNFYYGNPPFSNEVIYDMLFKAQHDFERDPRRTKFLFVLPKWTSSTWWGMTKQYQLLHEYPTGSTIFSAPATACTDAARLPSAGDSRVLPGGTPWPVVVLYRDFNTQPRIDAKLLAHLRFGHTHDKALRALVDNGTDLGKDLHAAKSCILGLPPCSDSCIGCRITKFSRPSPNRSGSTRASEPFAVVHTDVHGPLLSSHNGYRYVIGFLDEFSNFERIYFLREADGASMAASFSLFVEWAISVLRHRGDHQRVTNGDVIRCVQADNASTYTGGAFRDFCDAERIQQRFSAPYLHENQARIEGRWKTISASARAMLYTADLDKSFWVHAYRHAIFLLNRLPSAVLSDKSPYETLYGKAPDLSTVRVFGCPAFTFVDANTRDKNDDRARQLIYVGHSDNSPAYNLIDVNKPTKVVQSGMVKFNENLLSAGRILRSWEAFDPLPSDFDNCTLDAELITKLEGTSTAILSFRAYHDTEDDEIYAVVKVPSVKHPSGVWITVANYLRDQPDRLALVEDIVDNAFPPGVVNPFYPLFTRVTVFSKLPDQSRNKKTPAIVSGYDRNSELSYQLVLIDDDDLETFDAKKSDITFHDHEIAAAAATVLPPGVTEPKSLRQAFRAPDADEWRKARNNEFDPIYEMGGVQLPLQRSEIPPEVNTVNIIAVLKAKLLKDGSLDKRKVRFCGQGFLQLFGVDYFETFAPGIQLTSLRIILILAVNFGLDAYHCDVKNAYLNADLDECIYARMPREFVSDKYQHLLDGINDTHVYAKITKSLYGLKQAGRNWSKLSHETIVLCDNRLQRSRAEPCLYFLWTSDLKVLILVHVDDYVICTNSPSWYRSFMNKFQTHFIVNELGRLDQVLGIGISWNPDGSCELSQQRHIIEMLNKFNLKDANPVNTPMVVNAHFEPAKKLDEKLPYRHAIGGLRWIERCTRPDISFAVGLLSRFNNAFDHVHFTAVKRVLRYLKGTAEKTFKINKVSFTPTSVPLVAYTDSDWAGDKNSRRSTSGYIIQIFGNTVSFGSKVQKTVALSSTEAELMAVTEGVKEILYIKNLLSEFIEVQLPIPVHVDNQGAWHLARNPVNASRSKHIELRHFYIRDYVSAGTIMILNIDTADNVSDLFTKSQPAEVFTPQADIALNHV